MNDLNTPPSSEPLESSPAAPVITLRQARERAGLQIGALAAMLKVPVRRLESLEAGRFDELPDMTFARTLALSVCRALKVDPQPILAHFPASAEVRLGDIDRSLNAPMPARSPMLSSEPKPAPGTGLSWPKALAVLIGVVAVVFWFLLPSRDDALPVTVSVTPPQTTATLPERADEAQDPSVSEVDATPGPSIEPIEPPVGEPALPVDAMNGLAMTARETTWVQVTGASGRVLLQRSLQPGETVVLSTDFPLSVVVGRADEVTVSLRGEPFGLAPHTRNNVARFEVR